MGKNKYIFFSISVFSPLKCHFLKNKIRCLWADKIAIVMFFEIGKITDYRRV